MLQLGIPPLRPTQWYSPSLELRFRCPRSTIELGKIWVLCSAFSLSRTLFDVSLQQLESFRAIDVILSGPNGVNGRFGRKAVWLERKSKSWSEVVEMS